MLQKSVLRAAFAAATAATLPAFAGEVPAPANAARPLDLPGAVDLVGRTYPGRVIAAQADASGGESLHYHVDLLLPNSRVARLDVDSATGRIFNRIAPEEMPAAAPAMQDVLRHVEATTKGRVVSAEFDPDPTPHFHVNLRMPGGKLARYDVDAATQAISPHARR